MLAAKVVCMIDIEKAGTVSALWKFAGYGVTNGKRDKPEKGKKLPYCARLKTACYLVGSSFLKSNSPYREIYDSTKAYYETNREEWPKGQRHNAAMRKMIKVWLQHLWVIWRNMEGLPTSGPYVMDKLRHEHYLPPEDFGWLMDKDDSE